MSKKAAIIIPCAVIVLFCVALVIVESAAHPLRRLYDNYLLDNESHYLPCGKWPAPKEVEQVVNSHQEILRQIEQVNPGLVGIEIDTATCPGHADLLIWYASHTDRQAIKAIIGAETFFGIPYRMQNR